MKKTGILYRDIAEDIKQKIFRDEYTVGNLIPTENELSEQYDVSKITVRNAVEILVSEGYLAKKSGKGTFVISNRPFNHLSQAAAFSSILEEEGHQVTKKVVGISVVDNAEKPDEFQDSVSEITKVSRLYYLDNKPYIYTDHYINVPFARIASQDLITHSFYTVLQKESITIKRFEDIFAIEKVPENIKKYLELPNESSFFRIRYGYNAVEELVEYSVSYYNTEVHPYKMEYKV